MHNSDLSKNIKNEPLFSFFEIIVLGFMFLAAMNFITRYFYCVFLAFFVFLTVFWKKIKVDLDAIPLVVLALCIICFSTSTNSITSLIKPFTFLLCYLMGKNFVSKSDGAQKTQKRIEFAIILFALGAFVHLVLNLYYNIDIVTDVADIERNTYDYWTREILSATGQASLGCMAIGATTAILFSKRKIITKIIAIAVLLTVLYYNLMLAGRTLLIMTAISFGVAIIFLVFNKSEEKKGTLKPIITVIILVLIFLLLYQANVFDIKDSFEDSNFYQRFFGKNNTQDVSEDNRFQMKLSFLRNLNLSVFGGGNLRKDFGYAHDIFLDTYDDAGIFALIAIIVFIVSSVIVLVKSIKSTSFSLDFKLLVLCVYVILYIEFCIEPILLGMPWLFGVFCFIHGMLKTSIQSENSYKIALNN